MPPTLSITEPAGGDDVVTVGDLYNIIYTLADTDDVVTVGFYYDADNVGFDGTLISSGAAEGTGVTRAWNTTGMTPGTYYVYGITNDGANPDVKVYSTGQLTINAPNSAPTLSISEPDGTGDVVTVGDPYNITYTLGDTDDVVTVDFYYDTDNVGFDGTLISLGAAEGTGATSAWNTTGMLPGTYFVYGITNDGTNPQVDAYSSGKLNVK